MIGGDTQGFPNGRRLTDDVVDISERVVGGFLKGNKLPLGDGVDQIDKLLGAVAQHQIALGLLLICAFSAGLAATLTTLGLLPAISSGAIVAIGMVLTAQAVPKLI